jgi:hypothetical protein
MLGTDSFDYVSFLTAVTRPEYIPTQNINRVRFGQVAQ